jgi:hypothetical protein
METNLNYKLWVVEQYREAVEDPRYNQMIMAKVGWRPYFDYEEKVDEEEDNK